MTLLYTDDTVTLHEGDMRDVLPVLVAQGLRVDAVLADPPYEGTTHEWDRWPDGWPAVAAAAASSMWCFGSLRMFLDRRDEFTAWRLSHDVVWEKPNGTGFAADRFRGVHEQAAHWYRGPWKDVHHQTPRVAGTPRPSATIAARASIAHTGTINPGGYVYGDTRLARSVIFARSMHRRTRGRNRTEKSAEILGPLIEYAVPLGGVVLDPFAGSGATWETARGLGRRVVLIERDPACAADLAARLAADRADPLPLC